MSEIKHGDWLSAQPPAYPPEVADYRPAPTTTLVDCPACGERVSKLVSGSYPDALYLPGEILPHSRYADNGGAIVACSGGARRWFSPASMHGSGAGSLSRTAHREPRRESPTGRT